MRLSIIILLFSAVASAQPGMLLAGSEYNFTTPDEIPGLLAWWKADDGPKEADLTVPEDGDIVTQWDDSSGNGYTLTGSGTINYNVNQRGFTQRPFLTTTSGYFYNSSITGSMFTSGITAFIVFGTSTQSVDFDGILSCWDGPTNNRSWLLAQDTTGGNDAVALLVDADGVGGGSVISYGSISLSSSYTVAINWDGSDQYVNINGVTADSDTSPTMYSGSARFEVASYNTGSLPVRNIISISEIILFNTNISADNYRQMLNYLSWKYKTF